MMTLKGHTVLSHSLVSGDELFRIEMDSNLEDSDMCYDWFDFRSITEDTPWTPFSSLDRLIRLIRKLLLVLLGF